MRRRSQQGGESLPGPFIDPHVHVIPGVDDGPQDWGESAQLLSLLYQQGVRRLVATPHLYAPQGPREPGPLVEAFEGLEARLRELSHREEWVFLKDLTLDLGAEHYVSPEFFSALKERRLLPLNGSRYLLLEWPLPFSAGRIQKLAERILEKDLVPVLAHCERYPCFRQQLDPLASLVELGCLVQINANSVLLPRGSRRREVAEGMLQADLVHLIASDAHSPHLRPPRLEAAWHALSRRFSPQQAARWMRDNAAFILGRSRGSGRGPFALPQTDLGL